MVRKTIYIFIAAFASQASLAGDFNFDSISKRYPNVTFDAKVVKRAQMEGECLVGLKELNYRKKTEFDAIAEWTSYRSFSLLEQFDPCTVLIIMEVAQSKLKNSETLK